MPPCRRPRNRQPFRPAPVRNRSRQSLPRPPRTLGVWRSASDYSTTGACLTITHAAASSCHDIRTNGASGNAHDLTPEGRPLALNTPTIFNAALNFRLNWAGNFRSLEDQAEQTLRNPAIMASSADEVVRKLRADPETVRQFRDAYGREPDVAALLDAIATYERSLVTPGSRFDRWLAGDADAITPEELVRLSAVQVAWLHLLPPRRQCGRQPIPAARHFPSNGLPGAGIGARPQPA